MKTVPTSCSIPAAVIVLLYIMLLFSATWLLSNSLKSTLRSEANHRSDGTTVLLRSTPVSYCYSS